MSENQNPYILSGASLDALKLMAMILMVLDHLNETLLGETHYWMYGLGRGAYPLFAFAMACYLYKKPPLSGYLQRLVVFAILSQPCYMLAFHNNILNILFTLACGAVVGAWIIDQPAWRTHVLCVLALSAFFFKESADFGLPGVMLPGLMASVMLGKRFAWPWLIVMLLLLNITIVDFASLEDYELVFAPAEPEFFLAASGAIVVPWLVFQICRRIQGERFLPRYTLYIIYPAHLLLFGLLRLLWVDFPYGLLVF